MPHHSGSQPRSADVGLVEYGSGTGMRPLDSGTYPLTVVGDGHANPARCANTPVISALSE